MSFTFRNCILVCALALGACVSDTTESDEANAGKVEDGLTRAVGTGGRAAGSSELGGASLHGVAPKTPSLGGDGVRGGGEDQSENGEGQGGPPPVPWRLK
jgi:hypothetical protein